MINFAIQSTAKINFNGLIAPALKLEGINITGVASREIKNALYYQRIFNFEKSYYSYEELLKDKTVNCVYISTPNSAHSAETIQALRSGKHVLCEKPFCHRASSVQNINYEALHQNLFVMDAIHYHHYPLVGEIVDKIHSGHIGDIQKIDLNIEFPRPPLSDIRMSRELYGGSWMHMGCYIMHFCELLMPKEKWEIISLTKDFGDTDVDLWVKGSMRAANGCIVNFQTSYDAPKISSSMHIEGTKGFIKADEGFTPTTFYNFDPYVNMMIVHDQNGPWPVPNYRKTSYDFQLEAFKQKIDSGASGADASYEVYLMVEKIYKELYLHKRIKDSKCAIFNTDHDYKAL
jgi:predicted dehydrogenase